MKLKVVHIFENEVQTLSKMLVIDNGKVVFMCESLELPFVGNVRGISRIYTGIFECVKVGPTKKIPYPHFWIKGVNGRSGIKIHIANLVSQLRGCIAVGSKHKDINGDLELDVVESGKTLRKLRAILPDKFKIEII